MTCTTCSSVVVETSRFCPSCGTPIRVAAATATVAGTVAMDPGETTPMRPISSHPSNSRRKTTPIHVTSTPDFEEGRFLPGTLLADRYRIVGLLGKGGMGEVYRATDLRLNQAVALKFLPESAGQDPTVLARFYNEVRIARQITHPNVCRVFDIGEFEDSPFISMQFVDGENLASLLLRIGRLPVDKGVEITRKLCAGLAAAHAQGVLHRDLKPANIMIDGRGQVLIMDFGLAGLADDIRNADIRSGTPAYMAPEQLAGTEVSAKSDIYALGLIMYEIFTGKQAYRADTLAELVRARQESRPADISSIVRDMDPAIEGIIFRCLDPDPAKRPASPMAISAALPGGDPLAAALAAGETPSPEMVAAAGKEEHCLSRIPAIICISFILAALVSLLIIYSKQMMAAYIPFEAPPEGLAVQARKVIQQFGYSARPADNAYGFNYDWEYLAALREWAKKKHTQWSANMDSSIPLATFWYRESPRPLVGRDIDMIGRISDWGPAMKYSGEITLKTDAAGHLREFTAVPPQRDASPPVTTAPDAAPLFAAAGLDMSKFTAAAPEWTPLVATETRQAWSMHLPKFPDQIIRVEAAWWRNKPVYFAVLGPWNQPSRMVEPTWNKTEQYAYIFIDIFLMIGGCLLAWRNIRLGRGDRQGAFRVAAVTFTLTMVSALFWNHYVASLDAESVLDAAVGNALWKGTELWLIYMALEPTVRRRWPKILITWTRLLSGQWQDALVARDLLIGMVVGVSYSLLFTGFTLFALQRGGTPEASVQLVYLSGMRYVTAGIMNHVVNGFFGALFFFLLLFVLRMIVRKEWLAALIFTVGLASIRAAGSDWPWQAVIAYSLIYGTIVITLVRYGLLALFTAIFTTDLLVAFAFTTDLTAWYATGTVVATLLVAALAIWAFFKSQGGFRILSGLLEE